MQKTLKKILQSKYPHISFSVSTINNRIVITIKKSYIKDWGYFCKYQIGDWSNFYVVKTNLSIWSGEPYRIFQGIVDICSSLKIQKYDIVVGSRSSPYIHDIF